VLIENGTWYIDIVNTFSCSSEPDVPDEQIPLYGLYRY